MVNFKNGTLVKGAYVVIDGVEHEVYMPQYSGQTPLSAENMNKLQSDILQAVFPIGSTYVTQSDTNPNTILNFGTWERLKGKVCVGLDENDEDGYFDEIGKTGGEKEHTLTIDEIPAHTHMGTPALYRANEVTQQEEINSQTGRQGASGSAGGGQAHNNTQPYEVTGFMWIRRS